MKASALTRSTSCLTILLALGIAVSAVGAATNAPAVIPWIEIGAKAGADYRSEGLAIAPTSDSARLHCVFQRLDGEATAEGLWLTSTVTNTARDPSSIAVLRRVDRFCVKAIEVGLMASDGALKDQTQGLEPIVQLPDTGAVSVAGQTVHFSRPGLIEEYSVSMDGIRQDFVVQRLDKMQNAEGRMQNEGPPTRATGGNAGAGRELVVKLAVSGARVEQTTYGACPVRYPATTKEARYEDSLSHGVQLVLEKSGRKLAYSRLHVTDARGKELPARIEVQQQSEIPNHKSEIINHKSGMALAVVVDDADAVYPIRVDPTFSDANWVSMGGFLGANGTVYAAALDGSGNLYIGGSFTIAGNAIATNIARWDGTNWSALGLGVAGGNAVVNALLVDGGTLYVGGNFTTAGGITANNIAQWDGANWSALGPGLSYTVYALAASGGALYAGGGYTANCIAQWDGGSWSPLGSGLGGTGTPYVYALAVSGGTLYAGGFFATAGGIAATNIAQWDGTSWSALGSGMNKAVLALAVSGTTLYAAGPFTAAGGIVATNIAQWDGSNWSALGPGVGNGLSGDVSALALSGNTLYAGGQFVTAGGVAATNIALWDGTNWSALGAGVGAVLYNGVNAIAVSGGHVYAAGKFTTAGGVLASNIAQWNGSVWSDLAVGLNGEVDALAVSGTTLYAGGTFGKAGTNYLGTIAQWNGTGWSGLGSGMTGVGTSPSVSALLVSSNELYAGGSFGLAGGKPASCVAEWNGSSWRGLGQEVDTPGWNVQALALLGNTLYAGGVFPETLPPTAMIRWTGSNWVSLVFSLGAQVNALAVSGGTLYVGGSFTTAGGTAATNIAALNGTNWSAVGTGLNSNVYALAVSGTILYAGGTFKKAGGIAVSNIAQWNGNKWSPVGSGLNSNVYALATSGSMLYAGGSFTKAGSISANRVAVWNGSSWAALGSGIGGGFAPSVKALAVAANTLCVGGSFVTAGTNVSAYAALAYLPASLSILADNAFGLSNGVFGFDISGPAGSNVVIQGSTDLKNWVPLQTSPLGYGLVYFSDSQAPAFPQRSYRAQLQP